MQMVPNDLARQPSSNDMHIDLVRSCIGTNYTNFGPTRRDLRSHFEIYRSRSKVYVTNWLDKPNTMVSFLFLFLSYHKRYQLKTISVKNDNFSFDDLWRQNC